MDQTVCREGDGMTKMTDVAEIRDDTSTDNGVQPPSKSKSVQSLNELNSLKSQLGKTWSELSNIMNKYHAQVVVTHEQLEMTSLGADLSRISEMANDLKTLRTENGQLLKQIVENKAEIVKLRTENLTMRDEVTMKDNLIEKIQNQMSQEALDYQAELASLKEILEARSRGAEVTAPLIASPDAQPAKRRKVSVQHNMPTRAVVTTPAKRADVIPARTDVTPVRLDVTPVIANVNAAQTDVFSMLASSTPVLDAPSTSSSRNESFRTASASQISDSEYSAARDSITTSQDDRFVKLDDVADESNLEELEGVMSEQEEYMQGEASVLTEGLDSGQEQIRRVHDGDDTEQQETDKPKRKSRHLRHPLKNLLKETSADEQLPLKPASKSEKRATFRADSPTHSPLKPFQCKLCERRFTNKYTVQTHLKTQHGQKESCKNFVLSGDVTIDGKLAPFQCRVCKKHFTTKPDALGHLKKVHMRSDYKNLIQEGAELVKPNKCTICYKRFTSFGNARAHLKNVHNEISADEIELFITTLSLQNLSVGAKIEKE